MGSIHTIQKPPVEARVRLLALSGLLGLVCCFLTGVCSAEDRDPAPQVLDVFASIPPQIHFVEAIGKERVSCTAMVDPGESPATYEPTPKQIAALGKARLYFRIGVPFESIWMERIQEANPDMKVVDTAEGVDLLPMKRHYHGEDGDHAHSSAKSSGDKDGRKDPHVWLSVEAVKTQARNICNAFVTEDPDGRTFYEQNLDLFLDDLGRLDRTIADIFAKVSSRKFIALHPAWGYFARDYGLEQIPVELEGKQPSAKSLTHLIQLAQSENIRVVVVQRQFSTASARVIAEAIGARVVQLDPLDADYMENMKRIARTLAEAMK